MGCLAALVCLAVASAAGSSLIRRLSLLENWLIKGSCLSTHTGSVRERSAVRAARQLNLDPQPAFD